MRTHQRARGRTASRRLRPVNVKAPAIQGFSAPRPFLTFMPVSSTAMTLVKQKTTNQRTQPTSGSYLVMCFPLRIFLLVGPKGYSRGSVTLPDRPPEGTRCPRRFVEPSRNARTRDTYEPPGSSRRGGPTAEINPAARRELQWLHNCQLCADPASFACRALVSCSLASRCCPTWR